MIHEFDNSILLDSGRTIGYSVHGIDDGVPLLVFPGIPGSRYFQFCTEEMLARYNLKAYTLDRPGYGLSCISENRTILDWADDVSNFMNSLSINQAKLIGYSGGSPYALACAYAISDRFDYIGCVAGADPWSDNQIYTKLTKASQQLLSMFWHTPDKAYEVLINAQADAGKLYDTIMDTSATHDQQVFSCSINQKWLKENLLEAVKPNSLRHEFAYDFHLVSLPWGFDLSKIITEVHFWYGKQDTVELHSLNHGMYLSALLENTKMHIYNDEGWSILWSQTEQILQSLA